MSEIPSEISIDPASPEYVARVARAVLAVDHRGIRTSEVGAIVIGWLRAAHDQILVAAELAAAGHGGAVAPNVRAVHEVVIRLNWLRASTDRSASLRALFDAEAKLIADHPEHVAAMGIQLEPENTMPPIDVDRFGPLDPSLKGRARAVLHAAQAGSGSAGFYHEWHAATQFSHATSMLANAYAPRDRSGSFVDPDHAPDWTGLLHTVSLVICGLAAPLLIEDGVPPAEASSFFLASVTA